MQYIITGPKGYKTQVQSIDEISDLMLKYIDDNHSSCTCNRVITFQVQESVGYSYPSLIHLINSGGCWYFDGKRIKHT